MFLLAICLAVALSTLSAAGSFAHGGVHAPVNLFSVELGAEDEGGDLTGHCHGGASCGVAAFFGFPGLAFFDVPVDAGKSISKSSLTNLFSQGFDPPPPRYLS